VAYCNQADLSERFGDQELAELTDPSVATPNAAEITKACDEAASLIDTYVSTRYTVPLSPVPTIVRKWACDIARKFLWSDRAGPDTVVALNYLDAVGMLKNVASGLATLPDSTGDEPPGGDFSIAVVAPVAIFSKDVLDRAPGGPWTGYGQPSWETMLP
jgi:phage gp36-like protein